MRQRPGRRSALLSAIAGVACLALAAPAWANSTVPLHQSNVTADTFKNQNCQDKRFADRPADHDGWHFVLPGQASGDFVTITLQFTVPGGNEISITIPNADDAYPDHFYEAGGRVMHAYLYTPAGWTLRNGQASITGAGDKFVLSHTCAGTDQSSPSPSASPSTPASPGATASPSPNPSSASPGSPSPAVPGGDNGGEGGGLPITGAAAGTIALIGLALIGGGVTLVVIRRRRNITFSA